MLLLAKTLRTAMTTFESLQLTPFCFKKSSVSKNGQRGMCIKGLFWPPLDPKTESCFSPISSYWFVIRIAQKFCNILAFILLLPDAMVTKMVDKIGLK